MKSKILRKVAEVMICGVGFCTVVTVDQGLKNVKFNNRIIRGLTRFTASYVLAWAFATIVYLVRYQEDLSNGLDELTEEINNDMEEIDREMEDLEVSVEKVGNINDL